MYSGSESQAISSSLAVSTGSERNVEYNDFRKNIQCHCYSRSTNNNGCAVHSEHRSSGAGIICRQLRLYSVVFLQCCRCTNINISPQHIVRHATLIGYFLWRSTRATLYKLQGYALQRARSRPERGEYALNEKLIRGRFCEVMREREWRCACYQR